MKLATGIRIWDIHHLFAMQGLDQLLDVGLAWGLLNHNVVVHFKHYLQGLPIHVVGSYQQCCYEYSPYIYNYRKLCTDFLHKIKQSHCRSREKKIYSIHGWEVRESNLDPVDFIFNPCCNSVIITYGIFTLVEDLLFGRDTYNKRMNSLIIHI